MTAHDMTAHDMTAHGETVSKRQVRRSRSWEPGASPNGQRQSLKPSTSSSAMPPVPNARSHIHICSHCQNRQSHNFDIFQVWNRPVPKSQQFSGNGQSPEEFFTSFETAVTFAGIICDCAKALIISQRFSGPALLHFVSLPSETQRDYKLLKASMFGFFSQSCFQRSWIEAFANIQIEPTESMTDFAIRVQRTVKRAFPTLSSTHTNELSIHKFCEKLPSQLRHDVELQFPSSIIAAVTLAETIMRHTREKTSLSVPMQSRFQTQGVRHDSLSHRSQSRLERSQRWRQLKAQPCPVPVPELSTQGSTSGLSDRETCPRQAHSDRAHKRLERSQRWAFMRAQSRKPTTRREAIGSD